MRDRMPPRVLQWLAEAFGLSFSSVRRNMMVDRVSSPDAGLFSFCKSFLEDYSASCDGRPSTPAQLSGLHLCRSGRDLRKRGHCIFCAGERRNFSLARFLTARLIPDFAINSNCSFEMSGL